VNVQGQAGKEGGVWIFKNKPKQRRKTKPQEDYSRIFSLFRNHSDHARHTSALTPSCDSHQFTASFSASGVGIDILSATT
jgi:hypothetical protein